MMTFYNINGISTKEPIENKFWITEGFDNFVLKDNDHTYDIENLFFQLETIIIIKIFGSTKNYYSALPFIPDWISQAGVDSDIKISKQQFEKLVTNADPITCKYLYYYDFMSLSGTLRNSVIEVKNLMGQFYKELNLNSFMLHPQPMEADSTMIASGLMVTRLFTIINQIFISLYSQLDFMTKFCYELQYFDADYKSFKKLKSAKILYGDSTRLILNKKEGTLFESCINLKIIQTLRNEIVHNASFENRPKVFQVFEKNILVEKFILLPDFQSGIINSVKSRKRFFYDEIKLNEIMPGLIIDFWSRLLLTLKFLIDSEEKD